MSEREISRRRALQAGAALLAGSSLAECTVAGSPLAADESPTFVWNEIARGKEGPGPRSRHCFSYDSGRKTTVLFGGIIWGDDPTLHSDTWELKGGRWTLVKTATSPSPRHRGAMAYDRTRGLTVLYGGWDSEGTVQGETWTYSERGWRQLRATEIRPKPRGGHCMAFDEEIGAVVLFGGVDDDNGALGDTWLFDGSSWKQVPGESPPARRFSALAHDPGLKGCVLHAGAEDEHGKNTYGDEWLFRGRKWTKLAAAFDTDPRDDQGMGFHKTANRMVMLEGVAGVRGLLTREVEGWRKAEVKSLHPRHQCAPLIWDSSLDGLVMHGGEARHGGPQFDMTRVLRLAKNEKSS